MVKSKEFTLFNRYLVQVNLLPWNKLGLWKTRIRSASDSEMMHLVNVSVIQNTDLEDNLKQYAIQLVFLWVHILFTDFKCWNVPIVTPPSTDLTEEQKN